MVNGINKNKGEDINTMDKNRKVVFKGKVSAVWKGIVFFFLEGSHYDYLGAVLYYVKSFIWFSSFILAVLFLSERQLLPLVLCQYIGSASMVNNVELVSGLCNVWFSISILLFTIKTIKTLIPWSESDELRHVRHGMFVRSGYTMNLEIYVFCHSIMFSIVASFIQNLPLLIQ